MSSSLKKTPLYDFHVKHGAKMVPFAGYEMPVQYTGIKEEHHAVRNSAGLFDVSHMGEAVIHGPEATAAVDYLMTNNIAKLEVGQALYTTMCTPGGGIVDDLIVYRLADDNYMICLNASNREKDVAHMRKHIDGFDVRLEDQSDGYGQVALQGPKAEAILSRICEVDPATIKRFRIEEAVLNTAGGPVVAYVARTGYTGEDGFEIYFPKSAAERLAEALLEAGATDGLVLAGLGCRDTLRLEAMYMLYGNDIDEEHNPIEAGLSWVVKLKRKEDFVGKSALKAVRDAGPSRRFQAFKLDGRGVLRAGYPLKVNGNVVGVLTSGGYSPTLEASIAMGYLNAEVPEDAHVVAEVRGKDLALQQVKKFLE